MINKKNKKNLIKFLLNITLVFLLCTMTLSSCQVGETNALVPSAGRVGEIMVVMDSTKWNSEIAVTLKKILASPADGMLKDEPSFKLKFVQPKDFTGFFKKHRNLLLVATTDSKTVSGSPMQTVFGAEVFRKVNAGEDVFMYVKRNTFAKNQELIYVISDSDKKLVENLIKSKDKIKNYFEQQEFRRLAESFSMNKLSTDIATKINKRFGINAIIPAGMEIVKEDSAQNMPFIWFGDIKNNAYQNIYISSKPYINKEDLTEKNLVLWNNELGKKYITMASSYLTIETEMKPNFRTQTLNNEFVADLRGAWTLENHTKGGTFVCLTRLSTDKKRIISITAYVYAPSEDKIELMRRLEAVLRTMI